MNRMTTLLAVAVLVYAVGACGSAAAEPACVWLEAERPDEANHEAPDWSHPVLSGPEQKWVQLALNFGQAHQDLPADGLVLTYRFQVEAAGPYAFWTRVGYEWARTRMRWRIDDGPWHEVPKDRVTTNLMGIGLWCEVAWLKNGLVDLAAGRHTVTLRFPRPEAQEDANGKEQKPRFLVGLDCLAFVRGEGAFLPAGPLKPGETYHDDLDRQAAEHVYRPGGDAPADPGRRITVPLNGLWQVARHDDPDMDAGTYEPVRELPGAERLRWRGIEVPGNAFDRADLNLGHRLVYRARVDVPADWNGRGFHLHVSGSTWIASVFVNGRFAGGHESVLVPWDMDLSDHVRPGRVNEIAVAVKSGWYAIDPTVRGKTLDEHRNIPPSHMKWTLFCAPIFPSDKGEGRGLWTGLVYPVSLVVTGRVKTTDVFVRTTVVGDKRLDADVEVLNTTDAPAEVTVRCAAVSRKTGKVARTFDPVTVRVPAGKTQTVAVGGPWPDADLWWPERDAHLYDFRTALERGGKVVDVHEDAFGFREVGRDGRHFLLNGIRWHFWNWVDVPRNAQASESAWIAAYEAQNDRFHRMTSGDNRVWGCRENAIAAFNRLGVPGRLSTCIDGMFITHNLRNPRTWAHFANHVRQVVRAYRNDPSVMMWSLGNELLLITGRLRFWGEYRQWEEKAAHLSRLARDLDPTRGSFQDGGGDLGGLIDMNCQHYTWKRGEGFPAGAYAYPILPDGKPPVPRPRDQELLYMWDGAKPLVLGEVWFFGGNVDRVVWFGGPKVFRSMQDARKAAGRYAGICIEGARWQDATASCPWLAAYGDGPTSCAPRAVFVREHNACFASGGRMARTIRVFNDGRRRDPLTLRWRLVLGDETAAKGEKTYRIAPGHHQGDTLAAQLPKVSRRRDGRLELALSADGTTVFEDAKPVSVLPEPAGRHPGLSAATLAVLDAGGQVCRWLDAHGAAYTRLKEPADLAASAKVALVGPGTVTPENKKAVADRLKAFVAAGNTAVVLEQTHPLEKADLPVDGIEVSGPGKRFKGGWQEFRMAGGRSGAICFPTAPAHRVLAGLAERDFFTWAGGETNFALAYKTPSAGVIKLIQAGDGLDLTPMMEVLVGPGSYLLCQNTVGAKLDVEPAAGTLLANMLAWAGARGSERPGRTHVVASGDAALLETVRKTNVRFEEAAAPSEALQADVAVVRGTPANLAWLAEHKAAVERFARGGGWLMLANVSPKALDGFNALVGFRHRMRRFRAEAVALAAPDDLLAMGISINDLKMYGDDMIAPWAKIYRVSGRVFTTVVDGREIASFGGGPAQVTNGLTNEDFWQYIQYISSGGASHTFDFGRPERIVRVRIKPTAAPYHDLKDIRVVFDGRSDQAVAFTVPRDAPLTDVPVEPTTASKVTFAYRSHWPGESSKDLMGVDLIEIWREMPEGARPVLLTRPGGVVKYPIGKGGIVLNQVDYTERLADYSDLRGQTKTVIEQNLAKKIGIYSSLLRNMGATFRFKGEP